MITTVPFVPDTFLRLILDVARPKHRSVAAGFDFVFDATVNGFSIGFNFLSSIFHATLPRPLLPLYTL